jgi:hypothetical protein
MFLEESYLKKSQIFLVKYLKKPIKKSIPKNSPFFSTRRQIGGEQFYELKLPRLIGLYIS